MPLILPGNVASATASTTYDIGNSCQFNDGNTRLTRSFSAGDTAMWTWSGWVKRSKLGSRQIIFSAYNSSTYYTTMEFTANDEIKFNDENNNNTNGRIQSTRVFRDPNAWYHIVFHWDSSDGTSGDRLRMYVNNERITDFSDTGNAPSTTSQVNSNSVTHEIGSINGGTYFDGYMAEIFFIGGQNYNPSVFAEYDDDTPTIWKPKDCKADLDFSAANSFYLDFADSGDMGDDESGQGNDWTEDNCGGSDQSSDTPTNNFSTWNVLYPSGSVLSKGNTVGANNAGSAPQYISGISSIGMPINTGTYYCEIKLVSESSSGESLIGVGGDVETLNLADQTESGTGWFGLRNDNGLKYYNTGSATSQHNGFSAGNIMGLAFDSTNKKLTFSKNGGWWNGTGSWSGSSPDFSTHYIDCSSGSYGTFYFYGAASNGASVTSTWAANFGNGSFDGTAISSAGTNATDQDGLFEYDMPSSSKVLSTKGLNS